MLTILLVEDNEAIVLGLEYLLKEEGYRLLAAEDVKSAREILAKEQPDLVLLDVALPDGTGFDLCREIKAKGSGAGYFPDGQGRGAGRGAGV